ncbi:MAG: LysM domain-containing protein [Jatrophihabitantaceae bacterium]
MTAPSRYANLPTLTIQAADGRQIPYLSRRFLPRPDTGQTGTRYRVPAGQRIDVIAAIALGNAELGWLLADLNAARRPSDLQQPGSLIVIGPAGATNAL